MRFLWSVLFCISLLAFGCRGKKPVQPEWAASQAGSVQDPAATSRSGSGSKVIVTPSQASMGRVAFVNPNARYVVLSFPIGTSPALEKRFNIYRDGLKVGEIRITGPQIDNNTVGDITVGEARPGDEVRDN